MMRILMVTILTMVASSLALAQTTGTNYPGRDNDEKAIKRVIMQFEEAWNKHDVDACSSLFRPDAEFTSWKGERAQGRENIRKFLAPLFKNILKQSTLKSTRNRIQFYGQDIATVDSEWEMTGLLDQSLKPIPDRKYIPLFIVRKERGTWLIAVMHNVMLQPLCP
jgi:uncharacterized protein (TIGR02246 family)